LCTYVKFGGRGWGYFYEWQRNGRREKSRNVQFPLQICATILYLYDVRDHHRSSILGISNKQHDPSLYSGDSDTDLYLVLGPRMEECKDIPRIEDYKNRKDSKNSKERRGDGRRRI